MPISETKTTTPLKVIHVLGWELDNDQETEWPNLGFSCFDISSNIELEPKAVIQELEGDINSAISSGFNVGLVGHSIGGSYAAYMAEKYHLPVILINPLVRAYDSLLLADMLEDRQKALNIAQAQLQELEVAAAEPDRVLVMLQKGDKLKSYKEAMDYYHDCNQIILNGGSHQFDNLGNWVQVMTCFFNRHYE